jgi:FkbM family methyltransferase
MKIRDFLYIIRKDFKSYSSTILKVVKDYPNIRLINKEKVNEKSDLNVNIDLNERFVRGKINFEGFDILYLDYPSFLSTVEELFVNKIYSFESFENNPKIIDCGANIGLSILFFKLKFPNCKITAFEADPKVFECLKENIKSFDFDGVKLVNKALWDRETTLEFFSEGADGGRIDDNVVGNGQLIKVETTTLSDYIKEDIDFLKIDIEGAEYKVLEECKDFLVNVKNIFVEYHSFSDKTQVLDRILHILKDSGFRFYISSTGIKSLQPYEYINKSLGMDNQLNIFGYRNDN